MASCSSSSSPAPSKSSCSGSSPCSPYVRIPTSSTATTSTPVPVTSSNSPSHNHNHHHHHPHHRSQPLHATRSHSHRHYHLPSVAVPATNAAATTATAAAAAVGGDLFDDSSSSLSSTPSSATIVTSSSSTTSEELIPGRLEIAAAASAVIQSRNSNQNHSTSASSKNRKNLFPKRKGPDCQQMNDLNSSNLPHGHASSRRSRKTSSSDCHVPSPSAMDRNSSPAFHSGESSWTTFHFGPQNIVTTTTCTRNEMNTRLSPRCESEHYGSSNHSSSLDQRMRTATLGSGNSGTGTGSNSTSSSSPSRVSNGKAVAVIKGTASSTSRLSSNSFNGSSSDWKKHLHSHEIRKLKRELDQSEEKVSSLSSQLTTHSHMVTAFEQSLASMSLRLQQMTSMSSQKDCEIQRLKNRIDELKIGNGSPCLAGGGGKVTGGHEARIHSSSGGNNNTPPCTPSKKSSSQKNSSKDSDSHTHTRVKSGESGMREGKSSSSSLLIRRHTFVSPLNSDPSRHAQQQQQANESGSVKENSNRWFKAFRRTSSSSSSSSSKKNPAPANTPSSGSSGDQESIDGSNHHQNEAQFRYSNSRTGSMDSFSRIDAASLDPEVVNELKKQLREKEKTVTDLRLEALTSAHQLQSLEELVTQLRSEISSLRSENERLSVSCCSKSTTSIGAGVTVIHHKVNNNNSSGMNSTASGNSNSGNSQSSSSGGIEWPTSDETTSGYASFTSLPYFGTNS